MTFFQGQFLIAMPELKGSFFDCALIYLLEHDEQGAFGLMVNQELDISIGDILKQISADFDENKDSSLALNGGPVDTQCGFILHKPSNKDWAGQVKLNNNIYLTNSADILEAKARGEDIREYLIALGYSGWSGGQLEDEINNNTWLMVKANAEHILSLPTNKRLPACLDVLGIRYEQLSHNAGHS